MNAITIIILLGPIVLIVFFVLFLIRFIQMVLFNLRQNTLYRQRIKNYQEEKQLSNADLEIFHEAMEELRQQILRYEAATKKNKRLRAIEKEHGGLKSSKEIFQELMAHPDELTKFSDFCIMRSRVLRTPQKKSMRLPKWICQRLKSKNR